MNPHRIETTLTEDDYFAFNCFAHFRQKETRKAILFVQFAIPGALLLYFAWAHWRKHNADLLGQDSVAGMVQTVVFFLFCVVIMGVLMRRSMRKDIRKKLHENQRGLFDKPVAMELREEGVLVQNFFGQTTFPYSWVDGITERKDRVYVFFGADSGLILPRGKIPRETLDAFLDELKKRKGATP